MALSLDAFLSRPDIDGSPAYELIDGLAIQKLGADVHHCRLQLNLTNFINQKLPSHEALFELRCVVGGWALVPDISVVAAKQLPDDEGYLGIAPDWLIEIRLPSESKLNLQKKIAYCLMHGTRLAWLIDYATKQVWVWQGDSVPVAFSGDASLPVLGTQPKVLVSHVLQMAQRTVT